MRFVSRIAVAIVLTILQDDRRTSASWVTMQMDDYKTVSYANITHWDTRILVKYHAGVRSMTIRDPGVDVLKSSAIGDLPLLTNFELIGGSLEAIQPTAFVDLPHIDKIKIVQNRQLEGLPSRCFYDLNVRSIALSYNSLRAIADDAFENLLHLTALALNDNDLTAWNPRAFRNCPRLQHLDLHSNKLDRLPDDSFATLPSLRQLVLTNNRLQAIGLILNGLNAISELYLQQNFLASLPDALFAPFLKTTGFPANVRLKKRLVHLDISLNHLSLLPERIMNDLTALGSINTQLNPWNCHCMRLVERWTKANGIALNPNESMCLNPEDPICIVPLMDDGTCKQLNTTDVETFFGLLKPYCEFGA